MKQNYEKLVMKIIYIEKEDILTASGDFSGNDNDNLFNDW